MSLLDVIRGIPEKMGRGMERNIGGLLGIDPEDMTEEERRQARRLSQMAVFDAMARGTSPIAGLRQAAELLGTQRAERAQRREAEQRMTAAREASSQIAGRLMGGAPLPTAPGPAAGDELTGVNVQSQYRRDPMGAMQRAMTPAGIDAMQINPFLQPMLEQLSKPSEVRPLKFMSGPNGAIFALDEMTGEANEVVKAPPTVVPPAGGKSTYEGLRKEWTGLTKDYREIGNMWAKIRDAGTNPTAANDLAMIFGYMKILDPGSVVREGEFANAQNTAGVPGRIRAAYNNILRGERLTPEQRQEFLQSAYGAVKSQIPVLQALESQFRGIAAADNLDPTRIIINPLQGALLPRASGIDDPEYAKIPVGALYEGADGVIRIKGAQQ